MPNRLHLFDLFLCRLTSILFAVLVACCITPSSGYAQDDVSVEALKMDNALEGANVEVGLSDDRDVPTATWVSLDEDGSFSAKIFDLGDQADFRLQTEGVVLLTEVSGEFQFLRLNQTGKTSFKDVAPGIHMITFIGPGRFLVSAVHVIERGEWEEPLFPNQIELWCVNFGKREVDSIVLPYLTKGTSGARPEVDPSKVERISEIRRARVSGIETIQDVQEIPSVVLVNGGITGTVYRPGTSNSGTKLLDPLPDADILLVAEEETYSSIKTDSDGKFRFNSIKPGAYALLCTSNGGIAAIGMVVLPEKKDAMRMENADYRYVLQSSGAGGLALQTSPNVAVLSAAAAAAAAAGSSSSSSSGSSAAQGGTVASAAATVTTLSEMSDETNVPTLTDDTSEPSLDDDEASPADPPTL
jgi:hypothetical protein